VAVVGKELGMEAVVLAGGLGTRLRGVVSDRPKPMAIVAGRPFLEWIVRALKVQGVMRVIICTGYMGEQIEAHFKRRSDWGMEIECSREQSALGTWGSVRNALPLVKNDSFFVLNGDSLCRFDCARMSSEFNRHEAGALIWVVRVDEGNRYGSVQIGDDDDVTGFVEKFACRGAHYISAGVYMMKRDLVARLPIGRAASFERDLFPGLIGKGLYAIVGKGPFLDIGTPEAFANADEFIGTIKAFEEDA